jgi:predicted transcriptional regulator
MINFACKDIDFSEVVRCSFNLNKTEYKLLIKLVRQDKKLSIVEIARLTGFERSTVQKAIKKLVQERLVSRSQINLSRGGYVFTYRAKDKENVKKRTVNCIKLWSSRACQEVMNW